ncbi:hypothetical protein SynA1562_00149 [Synechococcus sp. A15-62]|nr:hypothetical protein SynA1562_00149 [Synechococcus sp. A15-62]
MIVIQNIYVLPKLYVLSYLALLPIIFLTKLMLPRARNADLTLFISLFVLALL